MRSILILLIICPICSAIPTSSPEYYIWHWHLKHELDVRSQKELFKIPIKGLFYRVGHFSAEGGQPHVKRIKKNLRFPEHFSGLNQFKEVHLAYSFGNSSSDSFVRKYLNKSPDAIIPWIVEIIRQDFTFFKALNSSVMGVQIDLEGGHINFEIFKDLMAELDNKLPKTLLSITPMSSWYSKKGIKDVLRHVDVVIPMLYDYRRGKRSSEPLKVSDWEWLPEVAMKWEQLGTPVIFGLPTYSYCVVYDHNSKLKIPWALVSPDTATESKALTEPSMTYNATDKSKLFSRDRVIDFKVAESWRFSNHLFKKGSRLKYNFVSSSALSQMITAIESKRGKLGLGYAFFRFGIPGEALVLDAWRIKRAVDQRFGRGFKFEIRKRLLNSEIILEVKNYGVPTYFGKTGFIMQIEGCEAKVANASDFDAVTESDGVLNLHEEYLKPYELLFSPTLKCDHDSTVKIIIHDASGVEHQRGIQLFNQDRWLLED